MAEQLAAAKAVQRVKEERRQKRALSSSAAVTGSTTSKNGFPFALTSRDTTTTTLDALVKGRTGSTRLSEKDKTVPIGSKNHAKPDPSANGERTTTSSRSKEGPARSSGGPAMSRPSTSASTSKPIPKPDCTDPKKPTREGSEEEDDDGLEITGGPQKRLRHKDGTVMEELVAGPKEFDAPADDPDWSRYEPYSGIHLKCVVHAFPHVGSLTLHFVGPEKTDRYWFASSHRERLLPHDQVDDLLVGRYHLTPSQIYSLARIDSRQRIDLDPEQIDSDFVVIGVLAWKDEIRFMNSNALGSGSKGGGYQKEEGKGKAAAEEEDEEEESDGDEAGGGKPRMATGSKNSQQQKPQGDNLFKAPTRRQRRQQYVRFSLVDLSSTSASSSATGQLSLMLVQADSEDKTVDEDGHEISVYKGQSGGAYEKFWKESAGAVVAIINPSFLPHHKVRGSLPPALRPRSQAADAKLSCHHRHRPQDFSYTLKPTSASSMVVIGRAENLAFCEAIKADGKRCGKWVDA